MIRRPKIDHDPAVSQEEETLRDPTMIPHQSLFPYRLKRRRNHGRLLAILLFLLTVGWWNQSQRSGLLLAAESSAALSSQGSHNTVTASPVATTISSKTRKKKSKKQLRQEQKERLAQWFSTEKVQGTLVLCHYVPRACAIRHRKFTLAAGVQMTVQWQHGVVYWTVILLLSCWVGICLEPAAQRKQSLPNQNQYAASVADSHATNNSRASCCINDTNDTDNHGEATETATASTAILSTGCAASINGCCQALFQNARDYWFGQESARISSPYPVAWYKFFLTSLILWELWHGTAPEINLMATPEIIQLHGGHLPSLPPMAPQTWIHDWLLHGLTEDTVNDWVHWMKLVRTCLLTTWSLYLLLPSSMPLVMAQWYRLQTQQQHSLEQVNAICDPILFTLTALCYTTGALCYGYMGTVSVSYCVSHCVQGAVVFIVGSIPAVPCLGTPQYATWLRRYLYLGVLVPIYLFSGICKIRYKGLVSNMWTGEWIADTFNPQDMESSSLPQMYQFVADHPWTHVVISWMNLIVEGLLPWAVLVGMDSWWIRSLFHVSCISFHVSIFFLMGPNFSRYALFHWLALDPWGCLWPPQTTEQPLLNQSPPITQSMNNPPNKIHDSRKSLMWKKTHLTNIACTAISVYVIVSWFWVQWKSDLDHLSGKLSPLKQRNPFMPFPEWSMFAKPTENANYGASLCLVLFSGILYMTVVFGKLGTKDKQASI